MTSPRKHHVSLLVGLWFYLTLPTIAVGQEANCNQPLTCNPIEAQANPLPQKNKELDTYNLESIMTELNLTEEQNKIIYLIVLEQTPKVKHYIADLAQAQLLLRNMALSKQYDKTVAQMLSETIADSTANLAILQANREFELFSMLNQEQIAHYNQLITTNITH
jgi:Spy/CpxP family protein refolding chaperone